ncbi:MAG: sugar transferase [Acidobacteriaceae bacterium]
MIKSATKNKSFPNIKYSYPSSKQEPLLLRAGADTMFCPRYVSAWCMSRRKRCFDLVLGVIALIVFLPVIALIALLIKMTSEGPALFCQERVGLRQQMFTIFKFRTMKIHRERLEHGPTVTRHGDPRMTKVGVWLRRLKLDELPQLINVARGDMSFVGPRPKIAEHENLCMLCRPGITGAATIEFSHEEGLLEGVPEEIVERYVTTVLNPEKCKLDVHYIETTNFRTDLRILLDTALKLGNRSRRIIPTESARFFLAKSGIEKSSDTITALAEGDLVPSEVRQSA